MTSRYEIDGPNYDWSSRFDGGFCDSLMSKSKINKKAINRIKSSAIKNVFKNCNHNQFQASGKGITPTSGSSSTFSSSSLGKMFLVLVKASRSSVN